MNTRERIEAFWSSEKPDQIPYTIYEWLYEGLADDPAWQQMFADGLGVVWHVFPADTEMQNVDVRVDEYQEDGHAVRRLTYTTPVGAITEATVNGWQGEFFLKTPEDYRVMTYVVDNTVLTPRHDLLVAKLAGLGDHEVVWSALSRTPYQRMLVDLAGVGQFPFHLYDFEQEVRELYEALARQFRRRVKIAADGPGRFVHFGENFNADAIGPQRYREFILPIYHECVGMLHDAGKIVGCHYDGRTASCAEVIAEAPVDLIESLTEPPEGDQTLAAARAAWPDKLLWCNIGVSDYQLLPAKLRERVLSMAADGAPDGRLLAMEVSEHLPANWRESMPVVLAALKETRCR